MFLAEQINVRVKHKGMTLAEWNKSTVILMERELGIATDTGEVRVGNGKDKWSSLPVIKGEKGDPLKVTSTTKNSQGDTVIKFDDGSIATVSKGDKGDSITVESHKKDSQGNTVINFSDGSNVTVDKGDSIKVESTSTDSKGNTLVKFSDGSIATVSKGDKGDPLKFEDLTQEQINQIKAQDVDLTNYATKDDLASVDVSGQLVDYAKGEFVEEAISSFVLAFADQYNSLDNELNGKADENHTHVITDVNGLQEELDGKASSKHYHDIADINNLQTALDLKASSDHTHDDVYAKGVGVDSNGIVKFLRDGKWYNYNSSSSIGNAVALKDHTHEITDVNGLQKELKTKASSKHYHDIADIDNLQTALNGKASSTHTHPEYLKKGDPITLTSAQKAELKGERGAPGTPGRAGTSITTWVGTQSEYDRIYSKSSSTLYLIKGWW